MSSVRVALGLALLGGICASGHQLLQGSLRHLGAASDADALQDSDPLPRGSRGEEPWPLYPAGSMPGRQIWPVPAESFSRPSPFNPISIMCSPFGGAAGNYYKDIVRPTLVPYLVDRSAPNRVDAAVVVAPGGGNDHLAFEVTGTDVAKWLNSLGISAFVVKYRVPARAWAEGSEVAMMDGQRALSLARSLSVSEGLGFAKIGLFGASAGGQLATRLATAASRTYPRVDAVDDLSFVPDFMLLLYPAIVPEVMSGAGRVPPTFISMSVGDPCVPVSDVLGFFREMKRQKAPPSEIHIYNNYRHGYGTCNMYPGWQNRAACRWTGEARRFLAAHLNMSMSGANASAAQFAKTGGPVWCPPANLACFPRSSCVGHCRADCWSRCAA